MTVTFREAVEGDLPAVVELLTDDALGKGREGGDLVRYREAFRTMARDGFNRLIVGQDETGRIVATYQLTILHGISLNAATRAQIEGVRVATDLRGGGIGAALLADAEARAKAGGATLLQFTTNRIRDRAHDFYRRAGYEDTHLGFKKSL